MLITKKLVVFVFFFIFSLVSVLQVRAFSDDFTTNPMANPNWSVQSSQGVTFDNPGITLSSYGKDRYPFISTTLDLSSNKYFEIDFQFLEASPWGVAGVFTDKIPTYGPILTTIQDYIDNTIASVWGSTLLVQSTICPDSVVQCLSGRWTVYPNTSPVYENTSSGVTDLSRHLFSIDRINLPNFLYQYKIYLDNDFIAATSPTNRLVDSIWIGNPQILDNTSNWPKMKLYKVRSLPENPNLALAFPYFSQKDPRWASEEYDNASKWAGLDKFGIGRWGCALSSAAMILDKNGVKALDGTPIDPSKLNAWLKTQPDGYVGLGYLNWIAVTRYVRLSYEAGHSPTKLEFTRSRTPTFPSIFGFPGHFVVAYGEDGSNWLVNDPSSTSITTIPKTTALSSVNTFVPSMTDLSYMMYVASTELDIKLTKGHRNIPIDWSSDSITDSESGNSGPNNRIGLVPKPTSGEYELKVTNPGNKFSNLDLYLYDKSGKQWIKKIKIGKDSKIKFELKYNSEKISKTKLEHEKQYRYEWNKNREERD